MTIMYILKNVCEAMIKYLLAAFVITMEESSLMFCLPLFSNPHPYYDNRHSNADNTGNNSNMYP